MKVRCKSTNENLSKVFDKLLQPHILGANSFIFSYCNRFVTEKRKIGMVKALGYNVDMKNIEEKIISNFDNIKTDIHTKFDLLWQSDERFTKHITKRLKDGHIQNKFDYISKTIECLANTDSFIFAQHDKSLDNICHNYKKDWAVIFNENGQIMTSFKIINESEGLFS